MVRCWLLVTGLLVTACASAGGVEGLQRSKQAVTDTLAGIDMDLAALSEPKRDAFPVIPDGRLPLVVEAMDEPLAMIDKSRQIAMTAPAGSVSRYVGSLLDPLGIDAGGVDEGKLDVPHAQQLRQALQAMAPEGGERQHLPDQWAGDTAAAKALRLLIGELVTARDAYKTAGGSPSAKELAAIGEHLSAVIDADVDKPQAYRLGVGEYHQLGSRVDITGLTEGLLRLTAAIEQVLPTLKSAAAKDLRGEWMTPLGRIRVSGDDPDRHSGDFALLIDLGGDDVYEDIGLSPAPGAVAVVIDVAGDDQVQWEKRPGPGVGVMGINAWVDLAGDDRYAGSNLGLGVGLLGGGLLWDAAGDDHYQSGALSQGIGQYGVGVMLDSGGNDHYATDMNSQGYGGSGGIGILADVAGNDSYACGGRVPDQVPARRQRHDAVHYLGFCQGYGFGRRRQTAGGVGLLVDRTGDDVYKADMFAQGSALWFGVGMLVDKAGNDRYRCFEHCQGESLHLAAGFLSDWGGDDQYIGYEHSQGTGVDRSVGILFDSAGDDRYAAHHESQGAGIKPRGKGMLIDVAGDDRYQASHAAQGYAMRLRPIFTDAYLPTGLLLDLAGDDVFNQPRVAPPTAKGRIQNRQGIAVDR